MGKFFSQLIACFSFSKHPSLEPPSIDVDEDHPSLEPPSMNVDEDRPSLQPPSMNVDEDRPSSSMNVQEDRPSSSMNVDEDRPSLQPPSIDVDEDRPSSSMNVHEDRPSSSINVDEDHPSPSMDVDEDERSILASKKKHDVFLSFRGEDTRRGFTSHLNASLTDGGVVTFIDDDELEQGHEISQALLDAIKNSTFSVVIFSENYADSRWCLDELVHILQCRQNKTQIVLPVFYGVDPSHVRRQKGSYNVMTKWNLSNSELKKRASDSQIEKWRTALTTAANLSGWDSSKARSDAELVKEIVKHIRRKLNTPDSINYSKQGLVGMPERVEDVKELLKNGSKVGICGMGGLGKTTLAKAVFNECRHQFDLHCFLPNFREEVEKHGKQYLVKKMYDLLKEHNGISVHKRLYQKNLLLVLDDVDSLTDYENSLKDEVDRFNSKSRVIITSRDKEVLRNICIGEENIYELQGLDEKEALELFYLHAFKGKGVQESYKKISKKFVDYADGVPLALKVLGSHLFQRKIEFWQSLLRQLKGGSPNQVVQNVLKISFDGLQEQEQNIFLDIACFYRGLPEHYVKLVLDACYSSSDVAIEVLIDRCLITLPEHVFEMHNLLKEMGQSIVRGSPENCPENYSRLWKSEDIYHVLKNKKVATTVKGLFQVDRRNVISLHPSTFEILPSLRILRPQTRNMEECFRNAEKTSSKWLDYIIWEGEWDFLERDFLESTFFNQLRYLEWDHCPLKSLGSNFIPHNLSGLIMKFSKLKKLWNETQDVENLKYVNLYGSNELTDLPNLSKANLKLLFLPHCKRLFYLPPLKFHDIPEDAEKDSEVMPQFIADDHECLLKCDWENELNSCLLDLYNCSNLKILSEMSGNIKFIRLSYTAIEELHSSIGLLKNLLVLDLCGCKCIKILPSSIRNLESLEYLSMFGCESIEKFPKLPESLKGLDLSGTSIQQVDSSSFECLPSLRLLYMNECKKLESLPTTICKLESLVTLRLRKCSRLKSFPEILEPMKNLEELNLNESGIEEMPSSIENLVVLHKLLLTSCKNLKCIPTTISKLKSLVNVDIRWCPQLKSFPKFLEPMEEPMEKLQKLCCGSFFYSFIISAPSEISASQLHKEVEQFKCRNSCSITSINILLRIKHSYGFKHGIPFTCCECFPFYSLYNILATQYLLEKKIEDRFRSYEGSMACFWYVGNEVPKWCSHQSVGSSIKVNLVPSLDNNFSFLGYAISLVVDFDPCTSNHEMVELNCDYSFRRNDGKISKFDSKLVICLVENNTISDWSSECVFIWYVDQFDLCGVEAFFKFGKRLNGGIKCCGVRLVYRDDAEEFDSAKPLF